MTTTRVSASVTLHRKPKDGKDGYLAQVTPSLINIVTDSQGYPLFEAYAPRTVEITDYEEGKPGFAVSEEKKVNAALFPHYTTYKSMTEGVNNSDARMRIRFSGVSEIKLVYSSYAEANYDYLMLSKLNTELSNNGANRVLYNDSRVAYHTRGAQTAAVEKVAEYTGLNKNAEYFVDVIFRKDGSGNHNDDCGYVAIPDVLSDTMRVELVPQMQNATGEVTFDYTKAQLPTGVGLAYMQDPASLKVSISKKVKVRQTELVLPVKDAGSGGVQTVYVPVNVTANGMGADSITVSAACHNGTDSQNTLCYLEINGKRVEKCVYYPTVWSDDDEEYARIKHNGYLPTYRGMAQYFINADTMECVEVDYYDTYEANADKRKKLYALMSSIAAWHIKNTTCPVIMVIITADASSCEAELRMMLNQYGSPIDTTYTMQRRRHYFVTNLRTAKAGQAYEDISEDPTQKRVTFPVVRGEGVILQGSTGQPGTMGYNGCIVRQTEWMEGIQYHNDTELSPEQCMEKYGTRTRYLDEVTVSGYDRGVGMKFLCKTTHEANTANKPKESGAVEVWDRMNMLKQPTYMPFADITRAVVQYLQAQQIVIKDPASRQPYAAFGAATADNPYPLWLGAAEPENAPFWVNANGEVHTTMIRRQMEFWDFRAHAHDDDYDMSTYLKKYCPSYIRASVYYEDDSGRTVWKDGITSLVRQEPRRYIVLPYAGHVLGKEVEIVVPNCFHNAANRGVIAISALSGQGQTPVLLDENQEKVYRPFDPSKSAKEPWGVEPGYAGLDFAVAEGNDGYFRSINGFWRSMILMDCIPDEWRVKANNTPRQFDDQTGIPDEDIYDRTSYVRLYAATQTLNGIKVPCWYIIESRNVKIIDHAGAVPVV